jgi:S1-C subfamily serine protease
MTDTIHEAASALAERAETSIVLLGGWCRGGSGVHLGGGRILTNAHHIGGDDTIVQKVTGEELEARVLGVDEDGDLAVLGAPIDGDGLSFSERPVTIGMPILALAAGQRGPRVTVGYVSAVGQAFRGPRGGRISGAIEHTAPMAPGSSGGALLDLDGDLIGINTRRLGGGFYLAVPTDAPTRSRIDRLASGEHVERPRLGIAIAPSWLAQRMRAAVGLASREGLLVREVEPGGRAAAAGLLVGDLIVAAGGRTMTDPEDLQAAIAEAAGTLALGLVRGEEEMELSVALG